MDAYSRCGLCEHHSFQCSACLKRDRAERTRLKNDAAGKRRLDTLLLSQTMLGAAEQSSAVGQIEPPPPAAVPPPADAPVKRTRAKRKPKILQAAQESAFSESEASESEDDDCENDHVLGQTAKKARGPTLPRINITERACVENWLQKNRKDGKMKNARWIRGAGAKGQSMTVASCEVKTQGAYESLAMFVNKHCKFGHNDARVWSADVAKRRWTSMYKSFKEAMLLGSKGNSLAGNTLVELMTHKTSLLVKQKAKCASFEILEALYSEHPSVHPAQPKEFGSVPIFANADNAEPSVVPVEGDGSSVVIDTATVSARSTAATVAADNEGAVAAAVVVTPVVGVADTVTPAVGGGKPVGVLTGKAAAEFHMKKSKEPKKMELGEAYLQAQQEKHKVYAISQAAKVKADLIQSLALAGKTHDEIVLFVSLL